MLAEHFGKRRNQMTLTIHCLGSFAWKFIVSTKKVYLLKGEVWNFPNFQNGKRYEDRHFHLAIGGSHVIQKVQNITNYLQAIPSH